MGKIRFAVVGTGAMGAGHLKGLKDVPDIQLVAVCDVREEQVNKVATEYGVKAFTDYRECLDAKNVDAVLIATPHYFHPPVAVYAMEHGIHVLSEKPVAVSVTEADRMSAAGRKAGVKYGVMFQQRTKMQFRRAHDMIQAGELGEIWRTCLIDTQWLRTQKYYDSGAWRATWAGEGGGVLMNQAPHALDMFVWLSGLPATVFGKTQTLHHDIEVEDSASALLTYPNGGYGYVVSSTWEAPGERTTEIVGSKGTLIINDTKVRVAKCEPGSVEFIRWKEEYGRYPKVEWLDVDESGSPEKPHRAVVENFCRAILHDEPLIAPGDECGKSLELANAILLSSYQKREVTLPLDRSAFDALLARLIQSSKPK